MKSNNFLMKSEKASFSIFIMQKIFPLELAVVLLLIPIIFFFFNLPVHYVPTMLKYFAMVFIPMLVASPLINAFISSSISTKLKYWRLVGLEKDERTSLYEQVMRFPLMKVIQVYILLLSSNVIFTDIFRRIFNVDFTMLLIINILFGLICYFMFLATYQIVENICFSIATELMNQGISEKRIKNKKVFGLKTSVRYFLYILLPIIFSGIILSQMLKLGYLPIKLHEAGKLTAIWKDLTEYELLGKDLIGFMPHNMFIHRLLFLCILSSIFVISSTALFFRRVINYSKQMSKALSIINTEQIGDTKIFAEDLSSEFSYSMYLINRLILQFQKIITNINSINLQINDYMKSLSSSAGQTSSTAVEELSSIEEIFATLNSNKSIALSVSSKINEIVKIVENTMSSINKNKNQLDENFVKMDEITKINRDTVTGIENLYTQINSIGDVTKLITSVAEQTKIIALNAELESGNISEGDAKLHSVATEIRDLADKTVYLTQKASEEISNIQESGHELISTGRSCMEKIEEANVLFEKLREKLLNVNTLLDNTLQDSLDVNNFIFEQNSSFEQIQQTLEQISNGMLNFIESTKSISEAVENLQKDSDYLKYINNSDEENEISEELEGENV